MVVEQIISIDGNVLTLYPLLQNYLIFELRNIHNYTCPYLVHYKITLDWHNCTGMVRFPICNWARYGVVTCLSVFILSKGFVFTAC